MKALLPVLLLMSGCAVLADWGTPSRPDALFPHPDGYDAGALHGADWFKAGRTGCAACHGAADSADTAKADDAGPPPCAECHEIYPHADDFMAGAVHGAGTWGEGGSTEVCETCHATDGLVASTQFGCTTCHASWPHPEGWDEGSQHGAWVHQRGSAVAACGSCHGDDLAGGTTAVSCTSCHTAYPHADDWLDAHPTVYAAGEGDCTACHGADLADPANDGGSAGVACSRCHPAFPHPEGWQRGHMKTAGAVGETGCLDCHSDGDGPAGMFATCADRCHDGSARARAAGDSPRPMTRGDR